MQAGELFVAIGVKGAEKTVAAFSKINYGVGEIKKTSLEAKAALLAVVYTIERLTSGAANEGMHLQALSTYLAVGVKDLQKWEYAAQQAGISNEQFESSLVSITKKIAQIRLGEGVPDKFSLFAQKIGGFDIEKSYQDRKYALEKIQQLANLKLNPADQLVRNSILEAFGLSPDFIGKIESKDVFSNVNKFKPGFSFLSQDEVKKLSDVKVQWDNIEKKVEMFFAHFTAKNGKEILTQLSDLSDHILAVADSLTILLDRLKVFKLLGDAAEGWDTIFKTLAPNESEEQKAAVDSLYKQQLKAVDEYNSKKIEQIGNFVPSLFSNFKSSVLESKSYLNPPHNENFQDILSNLFNFFPNNNEGIITPPSPLRPNNSSTNQTVNVSQNLNFQHEGKEYNRIQDASKTGILYAMKQTPAYAQAT